MDLCVFCLLTVKQESMSEDFVDDTMRVSCIPLYPMAKRLADEHEPGIQISYIKNI